jgi:hypothetical protein
VCVCGVGGGGGGAARAGMTEDSLNEFACVLINLI